MTDAEVRWLISGGESDPLQWVASLTRRPEWHARAACRGAGPDAFILGSGRNAAIMDRARAICATCPVTEDCLAYAMGDVDTVGIWAGTTGRERRAMRAEVA